MTKANQFRGPFMKNVLNKCEENLLENYWSILYRSNLNIQENLLEVWDWKIVIF